MGLKLEPEVHRRIVRKWLVDEMTRNGVEPDEQERLLARLESDLPRASVWDGRVYFDSQMPVVTSGLRYSAWLERQSTGVA